MLEKTLPGDPKVPLFTLKSAKGLIESGFSEVVLVHIGDYPEKDRLFIISEVLSSGGIEKAWKSISSIPVKDHQILAQTILDAGALDALISCLGDLKELDENIALPLRKAAKYEHLVFNIKSFKKDIRNKILLYFFEDGKEDLVRSSLGELEDLNTEIATKLLASNKEKNLLLIALNIKSFRDLAPSITAELIEAGYGELVLEKPESFEKLDTGMAQKLLEQKLGRFLALNLEKFDVLHSSIALELVKQGYTTNVMEHVDRFGSLGQDVAEAIVEKNHGEDINVVLDNIAKFKDLDFSALAKKVISVGDDFLLVDRISEFSDLDAEVALLLIEKDWAPTFRMNLDRFKDLTPAVFNVFLQVSKDRSKDIELVAQNLDKFSFISPSMAEEIVRNGDFELLEKSKDKILTTDSKKIEELKKKIEERRGITEAGKIIKAIDKNMTRFQTKLKTLDVDRFYRRYQESTVGNKYEERVVGDLNQRGIVVVERGEVDDTRGHYIKACFIVDIYGNKIAGPFEYKDNKSEYFLEESKFIVMGGFLFGENGQKISERFAKFYSVGKGRVAAQDEESEWYLLNNAGNKIAGPFEKIWQGRDKNSKIEVVLLDDKVDRNGDYKWHTIDD